MNLIRLILILIVVMLTGFVASAQDVPNNVPNNATDVPNNDKVCISQDAANKCAENARLITAYEAKIKALEDKVKAQEVTISDLKELNAKNVADLTDRLHKTELSLATKTGEVVMCEKNDVSNRAIIAAMIPMLRQKSFIKIF